MNGVIVSIIALLVELFNYNLNSFFIIFSLKDVKYIFRHHTAHHIPMAMILMMISRMARVNMLLLMSNCMSPYCKSEPTATNRITNFK